MLERQYRKTTTDIFAPKDEIFLIRKSLGNRSLSNEALIEQDYKAILNMAPLLKDMPGDFSEDLELGLEEPNWRRIRVALGSEGLRFGLEGTPGGLIASHGQLINHKEAITAGNLWFDEAGQLVKVSNKSGDYKPKPDTLQYLLIECHLAGIPISNQGLVLHAYNVLREDEDTVTATDTVGLIRPVHFGAIENQVFPISAEYIQELIQSALSHYLELKKENKYRNIENQKVNFGALESPEKKLSHSNTAASTAHSNIETPSLPPARKAPPATPKIANRSMLGASNRFHNSSPAFSNPFFSLPESPKRKDSSDDEAPSTPTPSTPAKKPRS